MTRGGEQLLQGRFEVIEEIGEGGFARVFHARETSTGRKVALKVLKDGFENDTEVMERFRREVFAVASIDSPHVVGLKDFGMSGSEFFIAMEFVEGTTLRDLLDGTPWSAVVVHSVVGQIANALGAAHRNNIVHRDLKPENVMIVGGPQETLMVKVLDFGLAKLAELERNLGLAQLTRVGMCFGTPQYMSPELIYGKPVDSMVDLFALAVMAYEMIAGRRPWDAAQPQEVMVAVAKTGMPPITRVHPSLTPRLEHINRFFQRALAKRKESRPVDANALFGELSEALFGERRPMILLPVRDAPPELASVAAKIPVRQERVDETQFDMGGRLNGGEGDGRTHSEFNSGFTNAGATEVGSPSRRSGRLSSAWIKSIASLSVMDEPAPAPPPDAAIADPFPNTTVPQQTMPEPQRGMPIAAMLIGLLGAIIVALTVGFFIGRGH